MGYKDDGACAKALILAAMAQSRVAGVFFFACNMDPSGVKPFETTPTLEPLLRSARAGLCSVISYAGRFQRLRRCRRL